MSPLKPERWRISAEELSDLYSRRRFAPGGAATREDLKDSIVCVPLDSFQPIYETVIRGFLDKLGVHPKAFAGDPGQVDGSETVILAGAAEKSLSRMAKLRSGMTFGLGELSQLVAPALPEKLSLDSLLEAESRIEAVRSLWSDEESRALYSDWIRIYSALLFDDTPKNLLGALFHDYTPAYFQLDLVDRRFYRHFVDCGAWNGDTLDDYLRIFDERFDSYVAFEPDPQSFASLRTRVRSLASAESRERIDLFECALGKKDGRAGFEVEPGGGSRLGRDNGLMVTTAMLDTILGERPVGFIKMEVEGGELDALRGAENVIRRQRPALAVTAYHEMSHLWEIPEAIATLGLGYRLHLRNHGFGSNRLTCYAVPLASARRDVRT